MEELAPSALTRKAFRQRVLRCESYCGRRDVTCRRWYARDKHVVWPCPVVFSDRGRDMRDSCPLFISPPWRAVLVLGSDLLHIDGSESESESSSMTFDVLRSCIETFAWKTSNGLESDLKGCEIISIIVPAARTRERGSYSKTSRLQDS